MNGIKKKLFIIILGLALFNGQTSFALPTDNQQAVAPPLPLPLPPLPILGRIDI